MKLQEDFSLEQSLLANNFSQRIIDEIRNFTNSTLNKNGS